MEMQVAEFLDKEWKWASYTAIVIEPYQNIQTQYAFDLTNYIHKPLL